MTYKDLTVVYLNFLSLFFNFYALLMKYNLPVSNILTEMIDTFSLRVITKTVSVYLFRRISDFLG